MAPSSPTPRGPRLLKALIVSTLAVALSHVILSDGLYLSFSGQAAATLGAGPGYGTDQAFTAAVVNTGLSMSLVLWIGMLVTGERRVGPMVLVGTVGWIAAVGNGVDTLDAAPYTLLPLGSLALVIVVTALSSAVRRK